MGLLLLCALVVAPNADALLSKVQSTYRKGGNLTLDFTQTYVSKLRPKPRVEKGKLWAVRDGRVRWSYDNPRKEFIFDGKTAHFYEPDNQQVTQYEGFADSQLATASRFLWGQGDLRQSFEVTPCDEECKSAPGEKTIRLELKKPAASVDHVLLTVDTTRNIVKRSVVLDKLGNRTTYEFSNLKFGVAIPDKMFTFDVPDSVQVIQANPRVSKQQAK